MLRRGGNGFVTAGRRRGFLPQRHHADDDGDGDEDQRHAHHHVSDGGIKIAIVERAVARGRDRAEQAREQAWASAQQRCGNGGDNTSVLVIHIKSPLAKSLGKYTTESIQLCKLIWRIR